MSIIKKLLRESLRNVILESPARELDLKKLHFLMEKKIRVGDNISKKLKTIDTPLSKQFLEFINSDKIKDDATVDYVDYDKSNEKLFTLGYEDQRGNTKERLIKFNKLMTYLGGNASEIKGYEVEELMGYLKKGDTDNFKLLGGVDILWAYHCENYDEGSTMGSCMRFGYAQKYLEIFASNPNQVKCLTLINPENNKVRGRALVWTLDDGEKFMDRRYTTNNQYDSQFNTYAEENGLTFGSPRSSEVTLENGGEFDYYPYMDTFEYYSPHNNLLSTNDGDLHLQDTNGGDNTGMWSDYLEENIPEEDACYVEHVESFVYCDDCCMSYDEDEMVLCNHEDVHELTGGEHQGSFALSKDIIETYDGEILLDYEVVQIDKGIHESEFAYSEDVMSDFEGNIILVEDSIELTHGEYAGEGALESDTFMVYEHERFVGYIADSDGDIEEYEKEPYSLERS